MPRFQRRQLLTRNRGSGSGGGGEPGGSGLVTPTPASSSSTSSRGGGASTTTTNGSSSQQRRQRRQSAICNGGGEVVHDGGGIITARLSSSNGVNADSPANGEEGSAAPVAHAADHGADGDDSEDILESDGDDIDEDEEECGEDSDGGDDVSQCSEHIPRTVPQRSTRGKRSVAVVGQAADMDSAFWGHETWLDENEDEEWATEDEGHYKDIFDSDFHESTEEDSDDNDASRSLDLDDTVTELRKLRRKRNYVDPKDKGSTTAAGPTKKVRVRAPWSRCKPGGPKYKEPSQSTHLAIAAQTEKMNNQAVLQHTERENLRKVQESAAENVPQLSGPVEMELSWSSDRLIQSEEDLRRQQLMRTPTATAGVTTGDGGSDGPTTTVRVVDGGETSAGHEAPFCREMIMFIDFTDPPSSRIPATYFQSTPDVPVAQRCAVSGMPAKYHDPLTGLFYSNCETFAALRYRYHRVAHKKAAAKLEEAEAHLQFLRTGVCR